MIYDVNEIRKDTVALINQINEQIEEVEKVARGRGIPATTLTDQHGNWSMIPLLSAKAMAYNTLVTLKMSEPQVHRPRSRPV